MNLIGDASPKYGIDKGRGVDLYVIEIFLQVFVVTLYN
jgi:hypothetical protein